jgi:hypothetical protein
MSRFKEIWSKLHKGIDTMITEESEGAERYEEIADEFHEMAEEEKGHQETLESMKAVNINYAGPTPKSKLAEQDLDGSEKWQFGNDITDSESARREAREANETFKSLTPDEKQRLKDLYAHLQQAKRNAEEHSYIKELEDEIEKLESKMKKGDVITSTQKELENISEKSEEAETMKQENSLIRKLREIQEKRQNKTLEMRGVKKSFKEFWSGR